jgi:hypothetical protein
MAPITWRNVGTPQFSDSVAALGLAGRFMDQAGTGFQAALGAFDTWRTEQNDRIALDAASRIQDPAEYRRALEAGTAIGGLPPTAVSSRTRAALDARAGELIGRQTAMDTMQRTARDDSAEVAARDTIARALGLAANGDQEGATRLLSQGAAAGLPISQQMAVAGRTSDLATANVNRAGQVIQNAQGSLNLERGRYNFGREQTAHNHEAIATEVLADARTNQWDSAGVQQELLRRNLPPAVLELVLPRLAQAGFNNVFPNASTPLPQPGTTPAAGAVAAAAAAPAPTPTATPRPVGQPPRNRAEAYETTFAHGRYVDLGGRNLTDMTLAEVEEAGQRQIAATRGRIGRSDDQGTSAMGAFQIINPTRAAIAERVLGPEWRSVRYTPEVQDRLARALYEQSRGGNLVSQWEGLRGQVVPGTNTPADQPGAYRNIPWEVAREQILAREAGGGANVPPTRVGTPQEDRTRANEEIRTANETIRDISQRRGQNLAMGPVIQNFMSDMENTNATAASLAGDLTRAASGNTPAGPLAGMDRLGLERDIQRIHDAAGGRITMAVAARIAQQSMRVNNQWNGNPFTESNARVVDMTVATPMAQQAGDAASNANGIRGQWENDQDLQSTNQVISSRIANVQNYAEQVRRLEAEAANRPGLAPALERLHTQLNQARRELNEALGSVRGRPGFAPRGPDNGGNVRRAEAPASGGRGATALAVAATEGGDAPASRTRTPTTPPALTAPTAQEVEARRAMLARAAEARNPSVEAFVASAVQTPPTQEQLVRAAYRLNIPVPQLETMIRAARTQQAAAQ